MIHDSTENYEARYNTVFFDHLLFPLEFKIHLGTLLFR